MALASVTGRRVVELCDGWQLAVTESGAAANPAALPPGLDWVDAVVPGTAAQALHKAGRWTPETPEPLHGKDIWYRTRLFGHGPRTLRFEGLATVAEVWLNGVRILASDNMFLDHEVDVDLGGDDALLNAFRSLDAALERRKARARWRTRLVESNSLRLIRTTLLGHMTGWQPAIHAVGPWRAVVLIEQSSHVRLRTIDMQATLDGDDGVLTIGLDIDWQGPTAPAIVEVGATSGPLSWIGAGRLEGALRLPGVEKWWPHTHGMPALHAVKVHLGDIEIDLGHTGFRSIGVERGADGKGFALQVNGQTVFARGACWNVADLESLTADRDRLQPWLALVREAHMNMVRVGGTMVYESDEFFALCDELGLLVWHDFMFANMDYPIADPAFRASVEAEAASFLRRTQRHPALAVLCGGSEVAQQAAMLGLPPALWSGPLYDDILPGLSAALRPDVPYVANSPSGGDLPFSTDDGVSHYYGVGAYLRPLEDARRANVRFTSECLAFANVPAVGTPGIAWDDLVRGKGGVPRDRGADWDFADVRDHYLRSLYEEDPAELKAADPKRYLRLSRAVSAGVMEAAIAEWRRPGSSCAGALVWMLKDCAPGAGWGVVGSGGRPKLAWHGLRRAFRPVQVSVTDEGLNGLAIHMVNDTEFAVRAKLSLHCFRAGDVCVLRRARDVELPPRGATTVRSTDLIGSFFDITYAYRFGPPPLEVAAVTLDEEETGARLAEAVYYPLGLSALDADPLLTVSPVRQGDGWALRLGTARFAPRLQIEDMHYVALDEGFPLLPGEERSVRLHAVDGWQAPPAGDVFPGVGKAVGYDAANETAS